MASVSLAQEGIQPASPPRHLGRVAASHPALAASLVRPGARVLAEPRTPTGLAPLDALLEGGFPRGQLTARGGWAALIDGTDGLDPASAETLGVSLDRLLWVRCGGRLPAAWRAADVLVHSGGFELVAVDLGDLPPWTLARTPPAVFVRLQRAVERQATGLLVAGPRRVAGSLAAV